MRRTEGYGEEIAHFRRDDLEVIETRMERFIPEEVITDASGNVRWLQTIKRPMLSVDGSVTQMLGVATDITVLTASNGKAGLRVRREFTERIDLIVTDVVMPPERP